MALADGNPGINKLARALDGKMKEYHDDLTSDLKLDFGVIQNDWKLLTNSFPVPIPKKDYRVCRHLAEIKLKTETATVPTHGTHYHDVKLPELKKGDHVLVAWVRNDPVVIDVIVSAEKLDGVWEYGRT